MGQGNIIGKPNLPATTGSKGLWSLREQYAANRESTWPGYDPQWANTRLLLKTASVTADTFIDSSANNFTVTKTGDTIQTTSTPYAPHWSNYFDGAGDSLNLASSAALNPAAGDFTFECWINPDNWTNATSALLATLVNTGLWIGKNGSNFVVRTAYVADLLQHATLPTVRVWTHVVVVRSGTTLSLFYNGSRVATVTNSTSFVQGPTYIGSDDGGGGSNFAGHISNMRFVKGTAVYSPSLTTLTVPTAPLTAIANTQLLTCQDNRFLDRSTNNLALTRVGNVAVSRFSPFAWAWTAASGGSGFFDGVGDHLTLSPNSAFTMGTGDFTVECWVLSTGVSNANGIFQISNTTYFNSTNGIALHAFSSGAWYIYTGAGLFTAGAWVPNAWYHCAVVRSSGVTRLYVNGVAVITQADTTNYTGTYLGIGGVFDTTDSNKHRGSISNFRVVKGTAVYTANFTPPTAPVTAVAGTSLLLNFTNAAFTDTATGNVVRQFGTPARGTVVPTGTALTASTFFNGTTDYLGVNTTPVCGFGGGDFTMECWFYKTTANLDVLLDTRPGAGGNALGMALYVQSNVLKAGNDAERIAGGTITNNTWNHCAVVRSGNTLNLYLNGTRTNSVAFSTTLASTCSPFIGKSATNEYTGGFIAGARFLRGAAYTGTTYTVPTAPHAMTAATALLLDQAVDVWDATARNNLTNTGTIVATPNMFTGSALSLNGSQVARAYSGTLATDFAFGTGDFTIEAWIYPTSNSGDRCIFSTRGNQANAVYFGMYTNAMTIGYYTASAWIVVSTVAVPLNAWSHVACVRSNGVVYLYINGTCVGSAANTTNLSESTAAVGRSIADNAYGFIGQIDELRVTRAARYLGTFSPSSAPFDRDWEPPYNDTLVTSNVLQLKSIGLAGATNNVFRDDSTNNFLPVRFGDTTQGSLSPYIPTGYWSAYLDGSGDHLSVANNAVLQFGTGDFTVEGWFFLDSAQNNLPAGLFSIGSFNDGVMLRYQNTVDSLYVNGTYYDWLPTTKLPKGQWNHVALVRASGTIRVYVNGMSVFSVANTANIVQATATTIGTNTHATAYTIGGHVSNFRVVKGTAVYTGTSFTPPTSPLTAISGTSLLTCQDNRLIDRSINNLAVTRVGDTAVARYSPFPFAVPVTTVATTNPGSVQLAVGNYLSIPANTAFDHTGDVTVEAWVYRTADTAGYHIFWGASQPGFIILGAQANRFALDIYYAGSVIHSPDTIVNNRWYHIAGVKTGSTARLYVDGVLKGSATMTGQTNSTQVNIGNVDGYGWPGFVSNLRFVKGTSVYTAAFTPPTAPLTAINGTTLLACQSPTATTDSSTNNFTLTKTGTVTPTDFNPFVTLPKRATYAYGGSGYFDGAGDRLTFTANSNMPSGNNSFSIEAWIYLNAFTGGGGGGGGLIIGWGSASTNNACALRTATGGEGGTTNGLVHYFWANDLYSSSNCIQVGRWHHVAVTYDGTTRRMFVDGALVGSNTPGTVNVTANTTVGIGGGVVSAGDFNGHIANLRVVRGTAVYTAAFTPPTSPVTAISGTSLLLNFDNAGVYDGTGRQNIITLGSASSSTVQRRHDQASQLVDGTISGFLPVPATSPTYVWGTGDFTIEFWVYRNVVAQQAIYDQRPTGTQGVYPTIYCEGANLNYHVSASIVIAGPSLAAGQWFHVAVSRAAAQTRMFVNGTQVGATYADTNNYINGTNRPLIGNNGFNTSDYRFNGYIENVRISRVGRYTANFTVPSESFPVA